MRVMKWLLPLLCCTLLAGCVSSVLIGSQLQSKLMYAFIRPLVGFDPSAINFFEAPIVRDRLQALLGDKYEHAMVLLNTAQQIRQEGALFYVLSRYAPPEVRQVTDQVKSVQEQIATVADTAGMVWNADTNQLAVLLVQDGTPQILSEQVAAAKAALTPTLPAELQAVYDTATAARAAVDAQRQQLQQTRELLDNPDDALEQLIREKTLETLPAPQ